MGLGNSSIIVNDTETLAFPSNEYIKSISIQRKYEIENQQNVLYHIVICKFNNSYVMWPKVLRELVNIKKLSTRGVNYKLSLVWAHYAAGYTDDQKKEHLREVECLDAFVKSLEDKRNYPKSSLFLYPHKDDANLCVDLHIHWRWNELVRAAVVHYNSYLPSNIYFDLIDYGTISPVEILPEIKK
jgi:hypothetical protein